MVSHVRPPGKPIGRTYRVHRGHRPRLCACGGRVTVVAVPTPRGDRPRLTCPTCTSTTAVAAGVAHAR